MILIGPHSHPYWVGVHLKYRGVDESGCGPYVRSKCWTLGSVFLKLVGASFFGRPCHRDIVF